MSLSSDFEILVATRNRGKILEIQKALRGSPIKLRYLDEFPNVPAVEEVGRTYEENAVLKAFGYSTATGVAALADDSGLEVDALGGLPGVLSARYGGTQSSDSERIHKLLAAISQCSDENRTARFICSMALVGWEMNSRDMQVRNLHLLKLTEGRCEGVITKAARGTNGFGFDPVFVPAGHNATFAELPNEVKATISHRAQALAAMRAFFDRGMM